MIRAALVALLLLMSLPPSAGAQQIVEMLADGTPVRSEDRHRLDNFNAAYGAAMRQALAGGAAADVRTLVSALKGAAQSVAPEALAGDWTCRVIKAGGVTPLIVYDAFRCRFSMKDRGVRFDKLGGSQRVSGAIHQDGEQLVLLGVGSIAGDTPPAYGDLPAGIDTTTSPQITAAPGVIEMTSADAGRIMFPYPMLESVMDVMVLSR